MQTEKCQKDDDPRVFLDPDGEYPFDLPTNQSRFPILKPLANFKDSLRNHRPAEISMVLILSFLNVAASLDARDPAVHTILSLLAVALVGLEIYLSYRYIQDTDEATKKKKY